MGRHRASRSAFGAATYVGRVGALALALGIGAAVAGGAGIAHADDTSDGGQSGAGSAQAPSDPNPTKVASTDTTADVDTAGGTAGAEAPKPGTPDVPKMVFSGGVPAHGDPASVADVLPTPPNEPEPESEPEPEAGSGSRTTIRAKDDPPKTGATASADGAVTTVVRARNTALRAAASTAEVDPPSTPDANRQQPLAVSPAASVTTVVVPAATVSTPVAPRFANPIVEVLATVLNGLGFPESVTAGDHPMEPLPILFAALDLVRRELEHFATNVSSAVAYYHSSLVPVPPSLAGAVLDPRDEVDTAYGDIGKWMLEPDGQISDYGGQVYGGRSLLEPVNVIIVDPTSTSSSQAIFKMYSAMFLGGFPPQPIHSTGFLGSIDDVLYGQQPTGLLLGFSDNFFFLPNDHGRLFGPDPVETSAGYVWSGAFSTETIGFYNFLPAHTYVSSDWARTALAVRLIVTGRATYAGMVAMNNAVNSATATTGDHDGYAVVLRLN